VTLTVLILITTINLEGHILASRVPTGKHSFKLKGRTKYQTSDRATHVL